MNIDRILDTLVQHSVDFLLIGGVNFLLRHAPVLTFDVDVWIEDSPPNRAQCELALARLGAKWGPTETQWRPVEELPRGWLERQSVFCLTSEHGAIDIFRSVLGLPDWQAARARAVMCRTASGVSCWSLSDQDMLACQLALPPQEQKAARVAILRQAIAEEESGRE